MRFPFSLPKPRPLKSGDRPDTHNATHTVDATTLNAAAIAASTGSHSDAPEDESHGDRKRRDFAAENELLAWVCACYDDAGQARQAVERDWVLSCAAVEARQWFGWDDRAHRLVNLMVEDECDRYITDNLIAPLLTKWAALVTMTRPDASVAPQTDSDLDRQAAMEGRAILAHLDRRFGRQLQTIERVRYAGTCGISWVKTSWNPREKVEVPRFGPNQTVVGKSLYAAGEVTEEIVPPWEVYLDPSARSWSEVQWLIHATVKPISWFKERFGDKASEIDADADTPTVGGYGAFVDGFLSPYELSRTGTRARKAALCLELWHRPTDAYPRGRYIVATRDRLLHDGDAPYQFPIGDGNPFPFVRLVYQEAFGHPYGRGLVQDLRPLQMAYNRALSRVVERFDADVPTLLVQKGSQIGADAYHSGPGNIDVTEGRRFRRVDYATGAAPPVWQPQPGASPDVYRLKDWVWLDMQHIAGIHDVNMGGTPTGITAGVSIELLQQGDRTQMGLLLQAIEASAAEIGRKELALYGQFAAPHLPRLMGLSDTGNPDAARQQALAFRAITNGGSCEVLVTPGSATPKTTAGQNQEVLEYFKLGLLDPTNPAAEIAIRLMTLARSDEVLDMIAAWREQLAHAAQAQQAVQMQAAQAAQGQAATGQAATGQVGPNGPSPNLPPTGGLPPPNGGPVPPMPPLPINGPPAPMGPGGPTVPMGGP